MVFYQYTIGEQASALISHSLWLFNAIKHILDKKIRSHDRSFVRCSTKLLLLFRPIQIPDTLRSPLSSMHKGSIAKDWVMPGWQHYVLQRWHSACKGFWSLWKKMKDCSFKKKKKKMYLGLKKKCPWHD